MPAVFGSDASFTSEQLSLLHLYLLVTTMLLVTNVVLDAVVCALLHGHALHTLHMELVLVVLIITWRHLLLLIGIAGKLSSILPLLLGHHLCIQLLIGLRYVLALVMFEMHIVAFVLSRLIYV